LVRGEQWRDPMNNCMLVDTSKFVVVVKANQPSVFGAKGYISYLLQGKDGVRSEYGIDEDALFIRDDGPRLPLEPIKVVADGHGESEQLFERLLWLLKSDGAEAWLKGNTRGEILELLRQDLKRASTRSWGRARRSFCNRARISATLRRRRR